MLLAGSLQAAEWPASLQWLQRVELGTLVSGRIDKLTVEPGDRVTAGQLLLQLDGRGFAAEEKKAGALLHALREEHEESLRELERATEMYERTLLAEHDLQVAKNAVSRAAAQRQAAEVELLQARLKLEYSRIEAPFSGVIVERHGEPGEAVVVRLQSEPLLILARTDEMLARVELEESALAGLQQGQQAEVRVQGKTYSGSIRSIALEPVAGTGDTPRYRVDVQFSVPADRLLRAGQEALLVLP